MDDRVILHCDLNCFFASVEMLSHPEVRDIPMAVCGDPASRHGIILAKNDPAKRLGVKTAETVWQAKRKAPGLVLLPPHHGLYREYSRQVNAIYEQFTDLVEPFGIDESWLDITGSLHLFGGDAKAVADEIRRRVKEATGLTVSVGVSFNKVFAKLGSDYKKPDATTVISRENWRDIVWPLPVGDLLYVGQAAQEVLGRHGVKTIGQLAAVEEDKLTEWMGKMGRELYLYANGLDRSPVRRPEQQEPVKSVGNGSTFPQDLTRWDQVRPALGMLCDSVAMRLRKHGLYCGGVAVTLRRSDFTQRSRQTQLPSPTHLMRDIYDTALSLTGELWHSGEAIRSLTVTALYISESADSFQQLDLLGGAKQQKDEKQEKLEDAMAAIRGKYGTGAIHFAQSGPGHGWDD
ncbi:MAG: DNA polymerase IV [Oscillospiraceae bacterium]|nr:DNA polymerase IV [Oscillospiraceae bacterium]